MLKMKWRATGRGVGRGMGRGMGAMLIGIASGLAGLGATPARADVVPVPNGDFENPVLANGGFTGTGVTGWTTVQNGSMGVWNPVTWNAYQPAQYTNRQIGYINGGVIEVVVAATAVPNAVYTLTYKVLNRPGFQAGTRVTLYAGPVVLGEVVDTTATLPASGTSGLRTISAAVNDGDPAVGYPLRIQVAKVGTAGQANFDDFKLEATDAGSPCAGDVTLDGVVDDSDFVLFTQRYDLYFAEPDGLGDFNFDGLVDDIDFVLFAYGYNLYACPE